MTLRPITGRLGHKAGTPFFNARPETPMSQELASYTISITTNTTGDATVTADDSIHGLLHAVEYVVGNFSTTTSQSIVLSVTSTESAVDHTLLTLTDEDSNAWFYPRTLEHDNTGTALSTYTLPVINGRLKAVADECGNAKTGSLVVFYVPIS